MRRDLRRDALAAWQAGVAAVDPVACVAAALRGRPGLAAPTLVVAAGKAAAGMMRGAAPFLAPGSRCIVLSPRDAFSADEGPTEATQTPFSREALWSRARAADAAGLPASTVVLHGGHPHPTPEGFRSTARILADVDGLGDGDSLLFLISGGASALLEAPAEGITDDDLVRSHELLVASGLAIADINVVRGCLSAVKAGRLAERARPARVVTLAISDVEGDDARVIGSGPTVPCAESRREQATRARALLRGAGVLLPPRAMAVLEREASRACEHRAPDDAADFTVVASIEHARRAACAELERRGYRARVAPDYLRGETSSAVARVLAAIDGKAPGAADAVALGGETTVAIRGGRPGRGGRNLDLAARVALAVSGRQAVAVVVAGTDGCDGSSRAAGAAVDGGSAGRAERSGFPLAAALAAFDTEPALEAAGDLVVTGPTGTNVGDLVVAVARPPEA